MYWQTLLANENKTLIIRKIQNKKTRHFKITKKKIMFEGYKKVVKTE